MCRCAEDRCSAEPIEAVYRSIQIVPLLSRYFIYSLISPFNHLSVLIFPRFDPISIIGEFGDHLRWNSKPFFTLFPGSPFAPAEPVSPHPSKCRGSLKIYGSPFLDDRPIDAFLRRSSPNSSTSSIAERDPGANSINGNNLGNCLFESLRFESKEGIEKKRAEWRRRRMDFWTSLRFNNFPLEKGIVKWKIKCRGGNLTGEGM